MATVHIYERETDPREGEIWKETAAATMKITRSMNVEDINAWWRVARRMFRSGRLPLSYINATVGNKHINFDCGDTLRVIVDRKRAML